jgi:hypothetical protein
VPKPIEQTVWLVRVLVEGERPALGQAKAAGGQAPIGSNLRQTWSCDVDKAEGSALIHLGERPGSHAIGFDACLAELPTERLDERAVRISCDVENAVLCGRSIETVEAGTAEAERHIPEEMAPNPGAVHLGERQSSVPKVGGRVRVRFWKIHLRWQ